MIPNTGEISCMEYDGYPCHQRACLTCDGPSSKMCHSCVFDAYTVSGQANSCVPFCNNGYYTNDTDRVCYPCNSVCYTCNGPSIHNCTKCNPGYYLQPNSGTCLESCPPGSYSDENQRCQFCPVECSTCTNNSFCSSCASGYFWQSSKRNCHEVCPSGYYGDSNTYLCTPCDNACLTCTGPGKEQCQTCNTAAGYYLQLFSTICTQTCPDGYYPRNTGYCDFCPPSCRTCVAANNCTSCHSDYFLSPPVNGVQSCIVTCPDGYYKNFSTNTCSPCDSACITCQDSSKNACTSCSSNYFLDPRTSLGCLDSCPEGYWGPTICIACHFTCKTCNGNLESNCISCKPGYYLQPNENKCLTSCPASFFKNTTSNTCTPCNPACTSCFGPTANECYSCNSGYFLQQSSKSCLNSCISSPGTWANSQTNTCSPCDVACATCGSSSRTDCSSCNINYFLQPNSTACSSTCPSGYWKNTTGRICSPCVSPCVTCTSISNCQSCIVNYQVDPSTQKCVKSCSSGLYLDKSINSCSPCDSACSTCFGPTNFECTSCRPGYYWIESKTACVTSCSLVPGYWSDSSTEVCLPCSLGCADCSDGQADSCSACMTGYYFNSSTSTCNNSCSDGYYANKETLTCTECPSPCKNCSSLNLNEVSCLSCTSDFYLQPYPNSSICLPTCPGPDYCPDPLKGICSVCPSAPLWAVSTVCCLFAGFILAAFFSTICCKTYSIFDKLIAKRRQNIIIKPHSTYKLLMTFIATHPLLSIFLYKDKVINKASRSALFFIRVMILFILAAAVHNTQVIFCL